MPLQGPVLVPWYKNHGLNKSQQILKFWDEQRSLLYGGSQKQQAALQSYQAKNMQQDATSNPGSDKDRNNSASKYNSRKMNDELIKGITNGAVTSDSRGGSIVEKQNSK